MAVNKLAPVVWDCKYHIVFLPKYRYKIFTKEVKEPVRDEFRKLCVWLGISIIEGNVSKDHIHMWLAIPPKYAISKVVATYFNTWRHRIHFCHGIFRCGFSPQVKFMEQNRCYFF